MTQQLGGSTARLVGQLWGEIIEGLNNLTGNKDLRDQKLEGRPGDLPEHEIGANVDPGLNQAAQELGDEALEVIARYDIYDAPLSKEQLEGFIAWESGITDETRDLLRQDPELAKTFAQMNPQVREVLTLCNSPCIPKNATPDQAQRIQELLDRYSIPPNTPGLKGYFHEANDLNAAIDRLEQVAQISVEGNIITSAGTFHDLVRPLMDQEALSHAIRVKNRPNITEDDIRGAFPSPSGQSGHARSKHNFPKDLQADIINNPERIFIGINENGRQVTVFYRGGDVVITQDNTFTRVITAFGSSGTTKASGGQVRPGKPVDPIQWEGNPNYNEITI